ncbi:MAG: helix-turn-helix domain-containing protein [Parvularculaceae bacterium]
MSGGLKLAGREHPRVGGRPLADPAYHEEIVKVIGARLRQARLFRRVSQKELGDALGLSFQQIQKYEKGVNRISINILIIAACFLKTPIQYFIDGLPAGNAKSVGEENVCLPPFDISDAAMGLARDYDQIADPKVRRLLLGLVAALAPEE